MSLYGTDQSNWQPNQITEGDFIICKATEVQIMLTQHVTLNTR